MTSGSGNDLLPVLVQTITSQMFDEANTISQLLHASFHSNKATSTTCFDFLAGRALSELVALICDQASKLAAASENSSNHHNHRHHTYDRTGRGHHNSDGINSIKHLVGKLVDIYYNRERVLKTHANLLLEKKHREVGCVLGQMAALYYTQAREMSENIKAILLLKQSSSSSRNGIDASVYDAKTLKGFVRYLAGLYQFRAQFFKRSANELFKSENDSIGTIMSLYGALLVDHSGELISLADTGMSERLTDPSVMQSSASETARGISGKYFPPMLEGMVNSAISAKGSKSVAISPPLNSYDDVEEKHETESFSDEAEVPQELAKTGAQDRMTTRVRARDDVSNLAMRYAGANKEEANALHKQLGILNSEDDESLKNGYTIMLKVVEYQGMFKLRFSFCYFISSVFLISVKDRCC